MEVFLGRFPSMCVALNAAPQLRLEAEATQERRLEGVGCRRWFGSTRPRQVV